MGHLKGKTAIITGAGRAVLSDGRCGSIGYGIATAFAKEGANLVITGRNVAKLDKANMMQYIAPMDLKSFGLIPEIIGRLPILTHLEPLDRNALRSILTEPKNSIVKQYLVTLL